MIYSTIVPIYKGKKYISPIIEMMGKNADLIGAGNVIELILVNDYPGEPIDRFVEELVLERKNSGTQVDNLKVIVVNNDVNSGIHKSRINGINNCNGEFVLMLDQDDIIANDFFASQISHIKDGDVVVANGIEQKGDFDKVLYRYWIMQWTVKYLWFYVRFDSRIISPGQCLIRKDSIPELWLQNPLKNSGADDYMLWLLMLSKRAKFVINRNVLYTHVYTTNNYSLDVSRIKKSTEELLEIIEYDIKSKNKSKIASRINRTHKSLIVKVVEKINNID